jgi:DNA-binding HxlR family transcriptional regulator
VGERWSILLVREALQGSTRFSDFRSRLGIAPDVLSARLSGLVSAGVFETVDYQDAGDRRRQRYELTDAGRELSVILASLAQWGVKNVKTEKSSDYRFVESATRQPVAAFLRRRDGEIVDPADVVMRLRAG